MPLDHPAISSSASPYWLALYPRLSARAKRNLAALCLAGAMLAGPAASYARPAHTAAAVPPIASPAVSAPDAYSRPQVQNALRELGLPTTPSVPRVGAGGPDSPIPAAGNQFQVNSYTTNLQTVPAVALDADGDFVVVWHSGGSSGGDTLSYSIQGQRYNSVGTAQGTQFQVNTYTTNSQILPAVALDADGDFVVVWQSNGSSGGDTLSDSIQAQRYNSMGTAQGTQFQVNTYTTGTQRYATVALDADGDFVVVWASGGSSGGDTLSYSIQGQRYNSVGTTQGTQFQVNTYTTSLQSVPAVALDADGDFVVVWHSSGSSGTDTFGLSIQGQRYNSVGTAQGTQFQVNTYTTSTQSYTAVALDADGDFVVVWTSNGSSGGDTLNNSIQGQRYNSVGTAQGTQFQINTYTTAFQLRSAVALDADGDFVVAWQSYGSSGSDTLIYSIQGQRYNSVGTAQGAQFQVNTYTTSDQKRGDVALDSDGDFVVVWQSFGSSGGDTLGYSIQAQRFAVNSANWQINTYTTNAQGNAAVALDADGDFVVIWESNGSSGGDTLGYSIQGQRYNSAGTAQGAQFQVNTYTTANQRIPFVAMDDTGDFVVVWQSNGSSGGDTLGYSVQARRYNSAGVAQGAQFQVNSYTTNGQSRGDVALDSDGDFVITWHSNGSSGTDTGSYSVQAQRYNSVGTAQGTQFQVNTYTTGNQLFPHIAMDSAGDFVIVWQSTNASAGDTLGYSMQAQRYNSVGTAQGTQFQVNTYTTSDQFSADVAMDSAGDFVIAWTSTGSGGGDTLGNSVQAQRYNSVGTAQGAQFQVNTYTTSGQRFPAIAMDSDGDFAIAWESNGSNSSDTLGYSIQGRIFSKSGQALEGEFQVNTYTTGTQRYKSVALDSNGDFVVVWQSAGSFGNDSLGDSIQAARFDLGQLDYQVNTYTTGQQLNSAVAVDSAGDFVVVWQSYGSSGTDTLGYSIQARLFNAQGVPTGPQFQVNTYTTGYQRYPAVALDTDGDFVVVWESNGSSGTDTLYYSIQGQRYNSVGTAQGTQFQINTYTTSFQFFSTVALDADGDFVVVWNSAGSSGGDTLNYSVQGQRYNSVGTAQGTQFQINTYTTNNQIAPVVALDADGDFVIVWDSAGSSGGDTLGSSIQGQRYNSVGTAQATQFQVNTYTTNSQNYPAVALDADGDFVVVWYSNGSSGGDTLSDSIQGQRYNSVGTAQGAQFQINTYTTGNQSFPTVALDADGDFVVVWNSAGSSGGDTLNYSVQAQRYNSVGTVQGTQFQINTYTTNFQRNAAVALDTDGDFVVVWQSYGLTNPPFAPGAPGGKGTLSDAPFNDSNYAIAAARFQALGGAEPTALTDGAAGVGGEAPGGAWPLVAGALGALGALAAAAWARVRRR